MPNPKINDTDLAEPPPSPQFWGSQTRSRFKAPIIGGLGAGRICSNLRLIWYQGLK
jgi:hypothetical protein